MRVVRLTNLLFWCGNFQPSYIEVAHDAVREKSTADLPDDSDEPPAGPSSSALSQQQTGLFRDTEIYVGYSCIKLFEHKSAYAYCTVCNC